MIVAIELSKSVLPAIEYLASIFPCAREWLLKVKHTRSMCADRTLSLAQRERYLLLHDRVCQACISIGISLPPPPNFVVAP